MSVAATASSNAPTLSGLASGLNWTNIINEMVSIQEEPETTMGAQKTTLQTQNSAYQTVGNDLTTLQGDVKTLSNPNFFDSRTVSVGTPSVASATADQGTPLGTYTFKISKLATDASWQGATATADPLSSTDDVSGVTLSSAGFATPVTAGTFTVNGDQVSISSSDTLQSVFNKIATATGNAVTASYDSGTDEITLSSGSPIVLGNATDTSNFLQVTQLYNNGGHSVTSASALGGINLDNPVASANLATPITDGGSGNGEFLINGVAINFDASTDSINDILQRINDSAAGVTATYDAVNNQFQLTNKTTGDVGISMQDVAGKGNFLAATGLAGGSLTRGTDLQYSINGGGTLTSQSNTVDSTSSGITGLSVTALGAGTTSVTVQSDTATISSAISSFVTDYNAVENYISSQTATTTSASGTVTPGTLTGDMDIEGIATQLRQLATAAPSGLTGSVQTINDIGVASDGTDNTLTLDSSGLTAALTNNLSDIKTMFTDPTTGLATTLNSYLNNANGSNGVLATKENSNNRQSADITSSITALQQQISQNETELQNEFTNMETAISSINTQKQYLTDFFSSSTATTALATASSSSGSSTSSTTG